MKTAVLLVLTLVVGAFAQQALFAQADTAPGADDSRQTAKVNLELQDVSVSEAIEKLFKDTALKYELKPGVTGRIVEIRLRDIGFEEALGAIAKAARLTYRVSGGVYVIGPSEDAASEKPSDAAGEPSATEDGAALESAEGELSRPADETAPVQPGPLDLLGTLSDAPVYYGQPVPEWLGPGYFPYPYEMRYGNVSVISRYPPLLMGPVRRVITPGARYPRIPARVLPNPRGAGATE